MRLLRFFIAALAGILFNQMGAYAQNTDSLYTVDVSNIGKLTFPIVPHKRTQGTDTAFSVTYNARIYTFGIHSFRHETNFKLDSGKLKAFYKNLTNQLLKTQRVFLISSASLNTNGLEAVQLRYIAKFNVRGKLEPFMCYHLLLYVDRTMYNIGVSGPDNLRVSDSDLKSQFDKFSKTLKITEKSANLYQFYEVDDDNETAIKLADTTSHLIFTLLKLAFGLAVLVLIIKGVLYIYKLLNS